MASPFCTPSSRPLMFWTPLLIARLHHTDSELRIWWVISVPHPSHTVFGGLHVFMERLPGASTVVRSWMREIQPWHWCSQWSGWSSVPWKGRGGGEGEGSLRGSHVWAVRKWGSKWVGWEREWFLQKEQHVQRPRSKTLWAHNKPLIEHEFKKKSKSHVWL